MVTEQLLLQVNPRSQPLKQFNQNIKTGSNVSKY